MEARHEMLCWPATREASELEAASRLAQRTGRSWWSSSAAGRTDRVLLRHQRRFVFVFASIQGNSPFLLGDWAAFRSHRPGVDLVIQVQSIHVAVVLLKEYIGQQ